MLKAIKKGSIVQLYPGDTHKKVAKILDINELGYTFEMVEGTYPDKDIMPGAVLFQNHAKPISMILIK
jgi:hypothetical protein